MRQCSQELLAGVHGLGNSSSGLGEVGMALHELCLNLSNPAPVGPRRLAALDRWLPCTVP